MHNYSLVFVVNIVLVIEQTENKQKGREYPLNVRRVVT